jgi:CRP-like cAMP-binding protein
MLGAGFGGVYTAQHLLRNHVIRALEEASIEEDDRELRRQLLTFVMALLNKTVRNATVRCVEALDVLSLPKREFGLLAGNLPELRRSFESVMERRTSAATHAR